MSEVRVYRAKYLDSQTSIPTDRNTQHLPDNKTPTLAANDVHFEGGVIEPGLDVEPQEAGGDWVLQVGDLHCVAVLVTAQKLKWKTRYKYQILKEDRFMFDMSRITEVANSRLATRYPDYFGSILTAGCLKFMINIFPTAAEF